MDSPVRLTNLTLIMSPQSFLQVYGTRFTWAIGQALLPLSIEI